MYKVAVSAVSRSFIDIQFSYYILRASFPIKYQIQLIKWQTYSISDIVLTIIMNVLFY